MAPIAIAFAKMPNLEGSRYFATIAPTTSEWKMANVLSIASQPKLDFICFLIASSSRSKASKI
jgi:hypothetical protein